MVIEGEEGLGLHQQVGVDQAGLAAHARQDYKQAQLENRNKLIFQVYLSANRDDIIT